MEYSTEQSNLAIGRETDILTRELQAKVADLEARFASLSAAQTVVDQTAPSITNLLFNSDLNDSYNTRFEAVSGSGKSAKELAYFFTHALAASSLTIKTGLTHAGDAVTSAIKESTHPEWAGNIQNPKWDKANGTIIFGKTNTIDVPLGDFISGGTSFVGGHALRPGSPMFVTFLLARKSQYIYCPGRIFVGLWNNKAGSEGYLKGANYQLAGAKQGPETPAATVSAQYKIAIDTDQGYTLVSDVVTIADSPALANFSPNAYNYLSWPYIAGTVRVRIFRKLGAGNVFEISEQPQGSAYQDKGAVLSVDTGSTSFPTLANERSAIESYWASTPAVLQTLAVDGIAANWLQFRVILGVSTSVNFGNVENPFLRIGLTEPVGIRVTDGATNGTTTITSAAAQFTAAMTGKAFTLTDGLGNSHTGTVTYVSPTELTMSTSCPWSGTGNTLIIEDCVEDAFVIDKFGLDFNQGNWSPRAEDTAQRLQTTAAAPDGSSQGSGAIIVGDGGNLQYGGGYVKDPETWLLETFV